MDSEGDQILELPSSGTRSSRRKKDCGKKIASSRQKIRQIGKEIDASPDFKKIVKIEPYQILILKIINNHMADLQARFFFIEKFGSKSIDEEMSIICRSIDAIKQILEKNYRITEVK